MPSESSSLDEKCRCGHPRRRHLEPPGAQCVACSGDEERSWRHDFVPADAETAGEPEAPEGGLVTVSHPYGGAATTVSVATSNPTRRPPNAVAYVLEDGTPFEIALPGDATVRSEDGVLIVMHSQSPIQGLTQAKPWGDQ